MAAWLLLGLLACAVAACRHETRAKSGWVRGGSSQRWQTMEKHLRGLDVAMVTIGYRYQELYWAGMDSNWAYADYQLTKIRLSLENVLGRRPKRRVSAEDRFLPQPDEMQRTVAARERLAFDEASAALTAGGDSCHVAEGVGTLLVESPSVRQSPIRAPR